MIPDGWKILKGGSAEEISEFDIDGWINDMIAGLFSSYSVSANPALKYPEVEPKYEIVPVVKTPTIDPGDDVEIDLYLLGYGKPELNRATMQHSLHDVLADVESPVTVFPGYGGVLTAENRLEKLWRADPAYRIGMLPPSEFPGPGVSFVFPDAGFADDPGVDESPTNKAPGGYPYPIVESYVDGYPPLKIALQTEDPGLYLRNRYSGEYELTFSFLYGDEVSFKQSMNTATIEVRSLSERYWWVILVIAIASVIALLGLF